MLENCLDQILVRSEQIRREADNAGPRAELQHWQKRLAKFSFLLDQLRGQEVRAVIGILQCGKSKLIPVSVFESCPLRKVMT